MKIYCTRREYENELDRYVGQDIWILTSYLMSGPGRWVRIIERLGDKYVFNQIRLGIGGYSTADFDSKYTASVTKLNASVVYPKDICTTAELAENFQSA